MLMAIKLLLAMTILFSVKVPVKAIDQNDNYQLFTLRG